MLRFLFKYLSETVGDAKSVVAACPVPTSQHGATYSDIDRDWLEG